MAVHLQRRRLLQAGGAACLAGLLGRPGGARAASYPSMPIRLINPFAPGGSADMISRLFAQKLSEAAKASIIVVNMGGAGGTIGSDRVAKSAPDGYTLLLSNVASQAIAATLYSHLPYDALKDFEHIAMFGSFPNVLVVGPAVKANTYAEFIAEAKAHPGAMTFGSAGNGSSPQLSAELLKLRTGIQARHVPFKGAGPALMAVIGGEISFQFENASTAIPQVKGGKLRALGVTSAQRLAALPDVPTMQELGLEDFVVGSWYGVSAPAGTPQDVARIISRATVQVLKEPDMRAQLTAMGVQMPDFPPTGYRDFVAAEIARWAPLIKASGAKVD
jgi:tripartite-type tricarboxylate transporter receptor subunit TctC